MNFFYATKQCLLFRPCNQFIRFHYSSLMLYYDITILSISIVVQHTTFSYDTLKDDIQNYQITQENHFYNICDTVFVEITTWLMKLMIL